MLLITHPINIYGHGIILIFGFGLIGRSIVFALPKYTIFSSKNELPYSWTDFKQQQKDKELIVKYLLNWKKNKNNKILRINFIWSAGKGGFNASEQELESELISFINTVNFSEKIQSLFPTSQSFFHMLSSAGGLFEGQCNINNSNIPNPKRPYGHIKLKQECYLLEKNLNIQKFIYRPSSVYGFAGHSSRIGLIPTLIQNAIQYKVSPIYGGMHTLRDYIIANDVGNFIAKKTIYPIFNEKKLFILATGKPSTILEIIRKIESIFGRKFYVRYEASNINSANNTYSPQVLPDLFEPTSLEYGIRKTYMDLIGKKHGSL